PESPAQDCSVQAFAPSYQIRLKKNKISSGNPLPTIGRLTITTIFGFYFIQSNLLTKTQRTLRRTPMLQ
ncbi:MAG: hypothetical protein ACR2NN_15090, partial [Bryobacteraceae bacterium]